MSFIAAHHGELPALFDLLQAFTLRTAADLSFLRVFLRDTVAATFSLAEKQAVRGAAARPPSAAPHLACRRGPLYALTHWRARRRWQRGRQGREGGAPALTVGTSRARSTGAAAALLGAAAGGGGGRGGRPARAGGALPAGRVPRGQPAAGGAGAGGAAAGAAHAGGQLCGRAGRGGRGHAAGHGRRHVRPARRAGRRAPARLRRQTRHLSAARNAGGGSGLRAWIGEEREELTRG